jgi:hypothetical protein
MKALKYFLIVLMALPMLSIAQQSEGFKFKWKVAGEQKQRYSLNQSYGILVNKTEEKAFSPIMQIHEIRYNLPKGAIFCRMEDALHEHFNFWFKVRMGCDDSYSN